MLTTKTRVMYVIYVIYICGGAHCRMRSKGLDDQVEVRARPPERRNMASNRKTSILVVDDEPIIRDSLAEFLGQEGFSVAACASAEEALAQAAKESFDIALCDVQLPGLDGIALLDRLLKLNPEMFVLLI